MDDDKPSNRQGLAVYLLPLEAAQVSPSKSPKSGRRLLQVGSGCRRDVLESLVVRAAELALNVKCVTDDRDAMEELGLRSIADGGNLCHLAACTQPPYLEFSSRWGIAPGLVAPIAKALLADLSFLDAVATCRAQLSLDADDCALLTALKPAVVLVGRAPSEPEVDRLIAELVQVDGRTTRHAAGRTNQHDSGRVDVHLPANAGALHLSEYPVRPALMGFELDLHYPTPYLVRECVELVRRQAFFVDHRVCGPGPCADPVVASMEEGDCDSGRIQVWLGRVESEKLLRDGLAEILRREKSTRALGRLRNAERLKRAYALWLLLQRGYDLHRIAQEVLGVDSRRNRDAVREWLRTACRQALGIEGAAVTQVALLRHASDRPLETASDRERRAYLRGRGFPLADCGQRVKPRVREVSDTSVSWADGSLLAEAGAELPAGRGKRWRRARVERRT